MIFSTTLEMKDTLAIGRKLPGSVGSSPSRLMTGIRMDLFWAGGKTPSKMDRLQIVVRSGRNDDMAQFSRCDSRHSRQDAGRGWKRRRRRASGIVSDGLDLSLKRG